jgi:hypothetical protein
VHPEGLADRGHRLSEHAIADDAERGAGQVANRMIEVAEPARALPVPVAHRVAIRKQAAAQREDQRKRVLRNGVGRVVPDIRDNDAAPAHARQVDVVVAGRRDRDELQFRRRRDGVRAHRRLVGDHDIGIGDSLAHFVRGALVVNLQTRAETGVAAARHPPAALPDREIRRGRFESSSRKRSWATLESVCDAQQQRFTEMVGDQLHADRKAGGGLPAGDADRRNPQETERQRELARSIPRLRRPHPAMARRRERPE